MKMKEEAKKHKSLEYQRKKKLQKEVSKRTEAKKLSQWIGMGGEEEEAAAQAAAQD